MEGAKWWYSEGRQSPPLSMNLAIRKLLTSIFLAVAATAGNNISKILQKKGTVVLPPLSFKLKGFLHREENCFVYVSLKLVSNREQSYSHADMLLLYYDSSTLTNLSGSDF
ncbi:hypothetical protein ACFX13_007048 [Malus domestica]